MNIHYKLTEIFIRIDWDTVEWSFEKRSCAIEHFVNIFGVSVEEMGEVFGRNGILNINSVRTFRLLKVGICQAGIGRCLKLDGVARPVRV